MVRGNKALHLKMSYGEDNGSAEQQDAVEQLNSELPASNGEDDGSAEQDAAEQLNSQLKYYCPFRGQHDEA